jgi:hypothetical protein
VRKEEKRKSQGELITWQSGMIGQLETGLVGRKPYAQVILRGDERPFEVHGNHDVEHLDKPKNAADRLAFDCYLN